MACKFYEDANRNSMHGLWSTAQSCAVCGLWQDILEDEPEWDEAARSKSGLPNSQHVDFGRWSYLCSCSSVTLLHVRVKLLAMLATIIAFLF